MKHSQRLLIASLLAFGLVFGTVGAAMAGEYDEVPYCSGESVEGSLVAVDQENDLLILSTDLGLCKVSSINEVDSPIGSMFSYFGTTDEEALAGDLDAAAAATQYWVVFDEATASWVAAAEGDEGAIAVNVTAVIDNGDGTYALVFTPEGTEEAAAVSTSDAELAANLQAALDSLLVQFDLLTDEAGNTSVADSSGLADAYHDDGMGWGVLVKFFSLAQETGVSVDELVDMFESGMGVGQIFHEIGKSAFTGVGHLRKAANEAETTTTEDSAAPGNSNANGNANSNGNSGGNGGGNGNDGSNGNQDHQPGYCRNDNKGNGNGNSKGNGQNKKDCD